jgi:hypothetical protein
MPPAITSRQGTPVPLQEERNVASHGTFSLSLDDSPCREPESRQPDGRLNNTILILFSGRSGSTVLYYLYKRVMPSQRDPGRIQPSEGY